MSSKRKDIKKWIKKAEELEISKQHSKETLQNKKYSDLVAIANTFEIRRPAASQKRKIE